MEAGVVLSRRLVKHRAHRIFRGRCDRSRTERQTERVLWRRGALGTGRCGAGDRAGSACSSEGMSGVAPIHTTRSNRVPATMTTSVDSQDVCIQLKDAARHPLRLCCYRHRPFLSALQPRRRDDGQRDGAAYHARRLPLEGSHMASAHAGSSGSHGTTGVAQFVGLSDPAVLSGGSNSFLPDQLVQNQRLHVH